MSIENVSGNIEELSKLFTDEPGEELGDQAVEGVTYVPLTFVIAQGALLQRKKANLPYTTDSIEAARTTENPIGDTRQAA